jgi:hypothetical protein
VSHFFMKIGATVVLLMLFPINLVSQQSDYAAIFGDNWNKAQSFIDLNRKWIEPELKRNHIPFLQAAAIIFPELVRYSALRDKMEITLLKALYINMGDEYADFSIGPFQMKPSFAELVRDTAEIVLGKQAAIKFRKRSDYDDITKFRSDIVSDLESPVRELDYLIAFIRICERKYKLEKLDLKTKVKYQATAYNSGFRRTKKQIESMFDHKYFRTTILKGECYSYYDVSFYYMEKSVQKKE